VKKFIRDALGNARYRRDYVDLGFVDEACRGAYRFVYWPRRMGLPETVDGSPGRVMMYARILEWPARVARRDLKQKDSIDGEESTMGPGDGAGAGAGKGGGGGERSRLRSFIGEPSRFYRREALAHADILPTNYDGGPVAFLRVLSRPTDGARSRRAVLRAINDAYVAGGLWEKGGTYQTHWALVLSLRALDHPNEHMRVEAVCETEVGVAWGVGRASLGRLRVAPSSSSPSSSSPDDDGGPVPIEHMDPGRWYFCGGEGTAGELAFVRSGGETRVTLATRLRINRRLRAAVSALREGWLGAGPGAAGADVPGDLNAEQRAAYVDALRGRMAVVVGPGGVGKSHLVHRIMTRARGRRAGEPGYRFVLHLSPTHRVRMSALERILPSRRGRRPRSTPEGTEEGTEEGTDGSHGRTDDAARKAERAWTPGHLVDGAAPAMPRDLFRTVHWATYRPPNDAAWYDTHGVGASDRRRRFRPGTTMLERYVECLDDAANATTGTLFGGEAVSIPPRALVVVEEASMVSADQLADVLDTVAGNRNVSVVVVGDWRQLPPVLARGMPFVDLLDAGALPARRLVVNHRMKAAALQRFHDGMRAASDAASPRGRVRAPPAGPPPPPPPPPPGLADLVAASSGSVVLHPGCTLEKRAVARAASLVRSHVSSGGALWHDDSPGAAGRPRVLVVCPTNRLCVRLSAEIRSELGLSVPRAAGPRGRRGSDDDDGDDRTFVVGQAVVFSTNTRAFHNGERGTVVAVPRQRVALFDGDVRLGARQYAVRKHGGGGGGGGDAGSDGPAAANTTTTAVVIRARLPPNVLKVWVSDLKPADAVTVHGAQGSEADTLIYVSPRRVGDPLIDRRFFYTAVSRGKSLVHLVGNRHSMSPSGLAGRRRDYRTLQRLMTELQRRDDGRLAVRTLLMVAARIDRTADDADADADADSDADIALRRPDISLAIDIVSSRVWDALRAD
jgi:hypothetical protein